MKWSELPLHPSPKTLRQFAGAWLVLFLAVGARQYLAHGRHAVGLVLGGLALLVGLLGLIKPAAVRWVFAGWMILVFPLGWLVSQGVLLGMFYGVITPVGLYFRLRGRDVLGRRPPVNRRSFWVPKPAPTEVGRYFRPY